MNHIRDVRMEKGMSLKGMAEAMCVDVRTICRWEKKTPKIGVLQEIAEVLECSVDELYGDDEPIAKSIGKTGGIKKKEIAVQAIRSLAVTAIDDGRYRFVYTGEVYTLGRQSIYECVKIAVYLTDLVWRLRIMKTDWKEWVCCDNLDDMDWEEKYMIASVLFEEGGLLFTKEFQDAHAMCISLAKEEIGGLGEYIGRGMWMDISTTLFFALSAEVLQSWKAEMVCDSLVWAMIPKIGVKQEPDTYEGVSENTAWPYLLTEAPIMEIIGVDSDNNS